MSGSEGLCRLHLGVGEQQMKREGPPALASQGPGLWPGRDSPCQ